MNHQEKKMGKDINRRSHVSWSHTANIHVKRSPASLFVREIQYKSTHAVPLQKSLTVLSISKEVRNQYIHPRGFIHYLTIHSLLSNK